MFNTVFEKKAKVLDMERNVNTKEFNLARLDQEYLRLKTIRMFYLQQDVNKKEKLDNMFEAELAGHPLGPDPLGALQRHQDVKRAHDAANDARLAEQFGGPEPEAALKRRREVRDAFFSLKAPEAKRAKVALSEELPCDLPHAPGHTHTEINQFLSLRVTGHTHEELDKLFAKFGCNLLQVRIDGEDQQAQGLP